MKNNRSNSEQGQALVLIVLGMVALLGFTALAVDGSMLYSDRRFAQNAADAAALAGAAEAALSLENSHVSYTSWNCAGSGISSAASTARQAAVNRANDNGFVIDQNISDQHGVNTQCGVDTTNYWAEKYLDVHTMVTADTNPAFSQFVFQGPLRNTVEAVARVRPRMSLAYGYAVVALREDCPNSNTGGVHYDGNSSLILTGGGVFSNACMVKDGGVSVSVEPPEEGIVCTGSGCYDNNGASGNIVPAPQVSPSPIPRDVWDVPPPNCSGLPNLGDHTGGGTIQPGNYGRIRVNSSNDHLVMQPGLYCVSNGVTINGGSVTGFGVTIFLTGGDFSSTGGVQVNLTAPPAQGCAYCPPALPGVLIYLAQGNSGGVSLLGTSDSEYLGLVYAPSGTIEAGGTGSELSEIHAQLVADTVKLHGTTNVNIHFDDDQVYQIPTKIDLYR